MTFNNDDSSREPDEPLAERLRREALGDRPEFSREIHGQILNRIRGERLRVNPQPKPRLRYWPAIAAAAAVLVVSGLTASWVVRSHRAPMLDPPAQIAKDIGPFPARIGRPAIAATPLSITDSISCDDILSARLWPPEIRIDLPVVKISPLTETVGTQISTPPTIPGPAGRLLDGLSAPTNSARDALVDVVPPNIRELVRLFMADRNGRGLP